MSDGSMRESAAVFILRPALVISLAARISSFETAGKPMFAQCTPYSSRPRATSSFSSGVNITPGGCSPSRSVLS